MQLFMEVCKRYGGTGPYITTSSSDDSEGCLSGPQSLDGNRNAGPMRVDARQNISAVDAGGAYRSLRNNICSARGVDEGLPCTVVGYLVILCNKVFLMDRKD